MMKDVLTIGGTAPHWSADEAVPYQTALLAAGMRPVIVSQAHEVSFDGVSGLLLMGGTDLNPALYGEERGPHTEEPDDVRDQLELEVLASALDRDLPVLAICRGLQLLNVSRGGSLVQHLEPVERHRQRPKDKSLPAHEVEILPGTLLAGIAGNTAAWAVNSRHHQAIKRLGNGLRVAATHPADGVIEAVELPNRRFVLAVQWHPENQTQSNGGRLFEAFSQALT